MKKYSGILLSLIMFAFALCLPGCTAADAPNVLNSIATAVGGWTSFSAIALAVIEFIVRMVPSANPTSLILVLSEILHSLGNVIAALSKFLDSLGLQNVKQ